VNHYGLVTAPYDVLRFFSETHRGADAFRGRRGAFVGHNSVKVLLP